MTYITQRKPVTSVDRLFDSLVSEHSWLNPSRSFWTPENAKETDEEYVLTWEVPSFTKDDIKVSVQDCLLTVSGKTKYKSVNYTSTRQN